MGEEKKEKGIVLQLDPDIISRAITHALFDVGDHYGGRPKGLGMVVVQAAPQAAKPTLEKKLTAIVNEALNDPEFEQNMREAVFTGLLDGMRAKAQRVGDEVTKRELERLRNRVLDDQV